MLNSNQEFNHKIESHFCYAITYKYLRLKKLRNLEGWNNIIAMAFIVAPPNQCNSPFKHHKCNQQNLNGNSFNHKNNLKLNTKTFIQIQFWVTHIGIGVNLRF
jgi:hypothetical protein